MTPSHNIVFFGESGVGKSSIINMLRGSSEQQAKTSNAARGCTFESSPYPYHVDEGSFTLWDTAGLNEGDQGEVPDLKALASLYHLLRNLGDGVSLLVFCMRGPRINDAAHKNWKLFREIICQKKVPIVAAITHLESEESMDDWWVKNEGEFRKYEMNPNSKHDTGVACITATKGKKRAHGFCYEEEYKESRDKLRKLIVRNHSPQPWKVEPVQWFQETVNITRESNCWGTTVKEEIITLPGKGVYELKSRWGLETVDEAMALAKVLKGT